MSAESIAKALGGKCGMGRCPVPTHGRGRGDQNPSLSLRDGDDGRLLFNCFAGCDTRDVLAELRRRGLLDQGDRPERRHDLSKYARELWRQAVSIDGTLSEQYLRRHRGISIPLPASLRFHPRVKVPGRQLWLPTVIAAISGEDHRVISVQVTWLDHKTGAKADVRPHRKTFGRMHDGAVRLGAAGDVLGLAEGVETALSVMQLFDIPCWAVLGAERFCKINISPVVERLHIYSDADGVGLDKAKQAERHFAGRFQVELHIPGAGTDFNDALLTGRART